MDLLDYRDGHLCFDDPLPADVRCLLLDAFAHPDAACGEMLLLRAWLRAPEHLAVAVELYRHYVRLCRLPDALVVAERAMQLAGRRLALPDDWQSIDERCLASAAGSFRLLRFYLLALKAVSVLLLRLGHIDASRLRLEKLAALDRGGQLGATRLLEALNAFLPPAAPALRGRPTL